MIITSLSNKKIKDLLKLKEIKNIKKNKQYLIDGLHLVEEALNKKVVLELFIEEGFDKTIRANLDNIEITYIDKKIAKLLGDTVTNQGIFALCKIENKELNINKYKNILMLDRVQDPGNLGTIIRTADAFAFDCVLLGKGTANIYNAKVLRSMQGSNFHIDFFESVDLEEILEHLEDYDVFATSLQTDYSIEDIKEKKEKFAVILGNEGEGVSQNILNKVNQPVKITMPGQAESLNVAVSSAILMHYLKNILN